MSTSMSMSMSMSILIYKAPALMSLQNILYTCSTSLENIYSFDGIYSLEGIQRVTGVLQS